MAKIINPHRYKGEDYRPGDGFKDADHEKWACDRARKYGEAEKSAPETEVRKRKLK
ncbi:MAG: hypothetical protein JKY32_07570 [Rhizobiales bacterium]|nr:hypothetical protein [Hyphomicrobiales bacterium]